MKKIVLFVFFTLPLGLYSQNIYVKTGVNHTIYNYISSDGDKSTVLQPELGNAYEIGYTFPFRKLSRFSYETGLTLNEYNGVVGVSYSSIKWKTLYVGVQNSMAFSILKFNYFTLDAKVGLNVNTILYGKEAIDGVLYDLKKENDFNGLIFQSLFGLQANLVVSKDCHLSLGYNYSKSISTSSYPQVFSFETSQIMLGAHFKMMKSQKKQ